MTTEPVSKHAWTQDEAIAFEAARECITHLMAIHTAEIHDEEGKPNPDAARIVELRAQRLRLHEERAGLKVQDQMQIACIRSDYGARVRAWRSSRASTIASST